MDESRGRSKDKKVIKKLHNLDREMVTCKGMEREGRIIKGRNWDGKGI
jgi:hypothetical protein